MRFFLFCALALFYMQPAVAQNGAPKKSETKDVFDRGCGDDRGTDRCASAEHQKMRDLYGIESPDTLLKAGATLRRAMFVDGYGSDVVSVSFIRNPGATPQVEIHTPISEGGEPRRPLSASVSAEIWDQVIAKSRFFDEKLARELPTDQPDELMNICLHSWFVVAESVDPPRVIPNLIAGSGSEAKKRSPLLPVKADMEKGKIRTASEDTCTKGLAAAFAFDLADLARSALSECSTLDSNNYRNVTQLLRQCHRLEGDRLVAGEASQLLSKLDDALDSESPRNLEWLFVGTGPERATIFKDKIGTGRLSNSMITGIDADHAKITGQVSYFNKDNAIETADFSLNLLRQSNGFVIDTFTIGDRKPFRTD